MVIQKGKHCTMPGVNMYGTDLNVSIALNPATQTSFGFQEYYASNISETDHLIVKQRCTH